MKTMIKFILVSLVGFSVMCASAQDWKILAVNTNTGAINLPVSITLTNGTKIIDGVYLGTNAVGFVANGTNYWIHLP